jgi:hypothetical protein
MAQKNPLALVNEKFGGKDKLVDKLVSLLESDESKDELRKKLLGAANKKLLRLHDIASVVKEKYGSRDKLLQAAADGQGRGKDKDFVAKLEGFSTPRLVDVAKVSERKAKRAGAAAAGKAKSPVAAGAAAQKAKAKAKPAAAKGKAKAAGKSGGSAKTAE